MKFRARKRSVSRKRHASRGRKRLFPKKIIKFGRGLLKRGVNALRNAIKKKGSYKRRSRWGRMKRGKRLNAASFIQTGARAQRFARQVDLALFPLQSIKTMGQGFIQSNYNEQTMMMFFNNLNTDIYDDMSNCYGAPPSEDTKMHMKNSDWKIEFFNASNQQFHCDAYYFVAKKPIPTTMIGGSSTAALNTWIQNSWQDDEKATNFATKFAYTQIGITPFDSPLFCQWFTITKVKKVLMKVGQKHVFNLNKNMNRTLNYRHHKVEYTTIEPGTFCGIMIMFHGMHVADPTNVNEPKIGIAAIRADYVVTRSTQYARVYQKEDFATGYAKNMPVLEDYNVWNEAKGQHEENSLA